MTEYGLSGDLKGVSRKEDAVKAFLEIHGEQGPVLEQEENRLALWIPSSGCRGLLSK